MIKKINPFLIPWLISMIATFGSLFFSEVMKFPPCALCWYQRILMYPLVVLLGFGFFTRDKNIFKYTYPFILLGNILSLYHYALQKDWITQEMSACLNGIPCSGMYINWFDFITIPFLSFTAFTLLNIFYVTYWMLTKKKKTN